MRLLITNDDGVHAPGLAAVEEIYDSHEMDVTAPASEQSGVSHSITYLTPLTYKRVPRANGRDAFAVEGTPADCVKLAICELCPQRPDVVISGINIGLNAGINVLYSGTVAAAVEAAFFGIKSFAVSLEQDPNPNYRAAAEIARQVIEWVLANNRSDCGLFNINIPTVATKGRRDVRVVPMGLEHYGSQYIKRKDPLDRDYYWATVDPPPKPTAHETDLTALSEGFVTVTPLDFDLTHRAMLAEMPNWPKL